jgi:hypothetical protein
VIVLTLLLIVAFGCLAGTLFLLGFRLGGDRWLEEISRVRLEAAQAERQLHDLTRQAFATMVDEVERRRPW